MERAKEIFLFHQGTYYHAYNFLGCHTENGGAWFRCWAPNAKAIFVVGDFNDWDYNKNPMVRIDENGLWECFVSSVKNFDNYKFFIVTADDRTLYKADPYAFFSETNGKTASKVYTFSDFKWTDKKYYESKAGKNHYEEPMNIYEVNFASWKKQENGEYYTYRMLADELVPYAKEMGYTHIEIMPLAEYPYDGSWGYQATGYFSVTSRFGTPEDFRFFVNACHENGLGVILDWVPAHFPKDEHGLIEWDGGYLYENQGWDRMEHKNWGTRIFDFGRNEVQSFLVSSATFFIDKFHIDGLRVDAVASMLYLDYDRKPNEWIPNSKGNNKNLEAIAFLQKLNTAVLTEYPNVIMIAEESTAWPMVTKPAYVGGLGFNYKWNIGWMNDTLSYVSLDPFFRKDNHEKLTFSMFYAFSENFILPISHDEVVYGKKSLLNKMYGDYDQKFDAMRTFLVYMFAHPGKKLNFMGNEFAQFDEWNYTKGLDFMLLDFEKHKKMHEFCKVLNHTYLSNSELFEIDYSWEGFKWLTANDKTNNVVAFERRNKKGDSVICVANFSPMKLEHYKVGVPAGKYYCILNSDEERFGGSGNEVKCVSSEHYGINGFESSIELTLAPNSALLFKRQDFKINIVSEITPKTMEKQNSKNSSDEKTKSIADKIIDLKLQNQKQEKDSYAKTVTTVDGKEMTETDEINHLVSSLIETQEILNGNSLNEKRKVGRPRKILSEEELNKPKRKVGRPRKEEKIKKN